MDYAEEIQELKVQRADLETVVIRVQAAITSEEKGSDEHKQLRSKEHDLNVRIISLRQANEQKWT
jgi:hypothetical protein